MRKAVIIGATSGIGKEVAKQLLNEGWTVGVAGRRENLLNELKALAPERVHTQVVDINDENSPEAVRSLINRMGGMDMFFHSSGVGWRNEELNPELEIKTVETNAVGFVRMVTFAFNYFRHETNSVGGHIAVISSVAGTRGIGTAAAYSATKRFNYTYLNALRHLAGINKLNISITDIRPGFVDTDILKGNKYPMLMTVEYATKKIIKALRKQKRVAVIDWRYSILVFVLRLIPQVLWEKIKVRKA